MEQMCSKGVAVADNPLLAMLGRRGRGAIVDALRADPDHAWTLRGLARSADIPHTVAARAVRELQALGAVEANRPGRDARIRWLPDRPAARWLATLDPPNLAAAAAQRFAAAVPRQPPITRLLWWRATGDTPADPLCPVRVAIVWRGGPDDEEAALEAADAGLDAVAAAGLPHILVNTVSEEALRSGDATAQDMARGQSL